MLERAIILPGIPHPGQRFGQLYHGGDFIGSIALVDVQQRLIVHELIHSGGIGQVFGHHVLAPMRPVVGLEHHLRIREQRLRLGDIARPVVSVAHLRAAQGVEVMHGAGAVFRHPQRLHLREIGIHLSGRLGARRQLEDRLHPVDLHFA